MIADNDTRCSVVVVQHPAHAEIYHIVSKKPALPAESGGAGAMPTGGKPINIGQEQAAPAKKSSCCSSS